LYQLPPGAPQRGLFTDCLEEKFCEVCFARRAGINIDVKKGQLNPDVAALKPASFKMGA
jgi:hypothetical protein